MLKPFCVIAALSLTSIPTWAASYNPEHTVSIREAAELLNGLSSIAKGYVCGEDLEPNPGSPIPMKKPRYCQYNLDGPTIMKLTRNMNKLRVIIQVATEAQQRVLLNYGTDGSKPTTLQQVAFAKQAEANEALNKILEDPTPFDGEKFTYCEFKLGSADATRLNKISANDLSLIGKLMDEEGSKECETAAAAPPPPPPIPKGK